MFAQDFAQLVVSRTEQVLAHVPKEVKMADKIPGVGKNEAYRLADSGSHVMDAGDRVAIVFFELL